MESPTFTCPICEMTSGHPKDVEEGYCGNCHAWTGAACEMTPERVRDHTTREGRCPVCLHAADDHPHGGAVERPSFRVIYDRIYTR